MDLGRWMFLAVGATAAPEDGIEEVSAHLEPTRDGSRLVLTLEHDIHFFEVREDDASKAEVFDALGRCFGRDAEALKSELSTRGPAARIVLWSR